MSTYTTDIELTEIQSSICIPKSYDSLWALIRFQKKPLGWIWISCREQRTISVEDLQWEVANQLDIKLVQGIFEHNFDKQKANNYDQPISIIVCTRDRTAYLEKCLKRLLELEYPNFELIVVDNAPSNERTAELVSAMPQIRYVRENCPGLDWARNCGLEAASHSIVAFTDDDACVDRFWLQSINKVFQESEVMAVTGLVAPEELNTDAQYIFEFHYGGMGHGLKRKFFRRQQLTEQDLLWASSFGVGVNMAFRRSIFHQIGRFDVALDVGTPSGGGGDIEMFHRLVAQGHTLVYEPSMLVWHTHRREMSDLRKQIFDNGRSFGAYLLTCSRNKSVKRQEILFFLLIRWFYQWILKRILDSGKLPISLVWIELFGMLKSPLCYFLSQRHSKQVSTDLLSIEFQLESELRPISYKSTPASIKAK